MRDTPAMLRDLNVVEQRYQAVLQLLDAIPVNEVAERFGVARQTVHRWGGPLPGQRYCWPGYQSHAPNAHPWQTISAMPGLFPCGGAGRMIFRIVPKNARRGDHNVEDSDSQ